MDPFSIVLSVGGACSAVATVSTRLYKLIDATKNVDRSVKELQGEVDSLSRALESIKPVLKTQTDSVAEKRADPDESKEIWSSVQDTLSDCQATLDHLQQSLVDVSSKGVSIGRQAVKTVKLNMKQDDINSTRAQVRSHTAALQIMLQMVNLRATYLAPGAVIDELGPKIDQLRELLEKEQDIKGDTQLANASAHVARLHKSAQRVLSSATTASGASEHDPSVMGESMDEEVGAARSL